MEINKLIGYTELTVNGEVIPVKLGSWALEKFSEEYGVKLVELNSVFETLEIPATEDRPAQFIQAPKDTLKFLAHAIWAGANYCKKIKGEPQVPLIDVYEWIDEIGGASSPDSIKIMSEFYMSIQNGGPVSPPSTGKEGKSAKKKS
jgi:hypothetical protein